MLNFSESCFCSKVVASTQMSKPLLNLGFPEHLVLEIKSRNLFKISSWFSRFCPPKADFVKFACSSQVEFRMLNAESVVSMNSEREIFVVWVGNNFLKRTATEWDSVWAAILTFCRSISLQVKWIGRSLWHNTSVSNLFHKSVKSFFETRDPSGRVVTPSNRRFLQGRCNEIETLYDNVKFYRELCNEMQSCFYLAVQLLKTFYFYPALLTYLKIFTLT